MTPMTRLLVAFTGVIGLLWVAPAFVANIVHVAAVALVVTALALYAIVQLVTLTDES